jgi:hypothetical protein
MAHHHHHHHCLYLQVGVSTRATIYVGPVLSLSFSIFAGWSIQEGEHCSVQDARATMALFKLVRVQWERQILKRCGKSKTTKRRPGKQTNKAKSTKTVRGTVICRPHDSGDKCRESPVVGTSSFLDDQFWPDHIHIEDNESIGH